LIRLRVSGSTFAFTARFAQARAIPPAITTPPPADAMTMCGVRPQRILVAEDNPINQMVIARTLEKAGHLVALAKDGRQTLEIWAASCFDVIFMDVQMPEIDGIEATQEMRRREQVTGERICIMAMTANALSGDRDRCIAAGMDGYFTKPMRAQEVLGWLARREIVPNSMPGYVPLALCRATHSVARGNWLRRFAYGAIKPARMA
jgi:CheY-like chemotaxis protein